MNRRHDALPRLAAERAARKPDLIHAPPTPAAIAARRATQTTPIVFGAGTDPVGSGLVASLARPGGNVTGISAIAGSLAPKRVELLREIMPRVQRLGLLGDPDDPSSRTEYATLTALGPALGVTMVRADASNSAVLDAAIAKLLEQRPEAIFTDSAFAFNVRERLIEAATRARGPGDRMTRASDRSAAGRSPGGSGRVDVSGVWCLGRPARLERRRTRPRSPN